MGTTHAVWNGLVYSVVRPWTLPPQLRFILAGRPMPHALSWLYGKWVLAFCASSGSSPRPCPPPDTSQCSESCTGTTGKARMISCFGRRQRGRFAEFVYLNRLIRFRRCFSLLSSGTDGAKQYVVLLNLMGKRFPATLAFERHR